ncbi:hypothetical protein [Nocardiopsis sp. LOL_012]|uniref:hypothetical protein n=1 Tax=Nocardiopsis sp. LOL_012 TaxID=3345409 RepID=UPI003A843734
MAKKDANGKDSRKRGRDHEDEPRGTAQDDGPDEPPALEPDTGPKAEWPGAQRFPAPPPLLGQHAQEDGEEGREQHETKERKDRARKAQEADEQPPGWANIKEEELRNNEDTQKARRKGRSHDGHNLGYGSSRHSFGNVNASASFGASFGHVGGDFNNYFLYNTERAPRSGHYSEQDLDGISGRHVAAPSDELLMRTLGKEGVVFLRGTALSGRRTSALYCLDQAVLASGDERRVSILRCGEDLTELHAQVEADSHGPGFLLDATGAKWPRTATEAEFRAAFGGFASSGKRAVVLVDEPLLATHLAPLVVDHMGPPLDTVIGRHLAFLMAGRDEQPGEKARRTVQGIKSGTEPDAASATAWLRSMTFPEEAVLLARTLDLADQGEAGSIDKAAADQRRYWLDQYARRLLATTDAARTPRDQSHILAGAVLSGHPESTISAAAEVLADVLEEGREERPAAPPQFTEPGERRLRHMRVEEVTDQGPVLVLPQPELGAALLHVTWFEYSRTQKSLVEWLALLCEDENSTIGAVLSATQALAQLAAYEQSTVFERTVERWHDWVDHDPPVHCLWASSWLLERLVFNQSPTPGTLDDSGPDDPRGRIVSNVARKLRAWADPERLEEAHGSGRAAPAHFPRWITAMMAYGTYVSTVPPVRDDLGDVLRKAAHLSIRTRRIALLLASPKTATELYKLSEFYGNVLVSSTTDAYRSGARKEVVEELCRWVDERSPALLLMACRVMLGIAAIRGDAPREWAGAGHVEGDTAPFDLLLWLSSDGAELPLGAREGIRSLWIASLSHPDTRQLAWRRLFRWDLQAHPPGTAHGDTGAAPPATAGMRRFLDDLFREIGGDLRLKLLWKELGTYRRLRHRVAPDQFPDTEAPGGFR